MNTSPINLLFRFFQNKNDVSISLQGNIFDKFYGKILGFDEFMNLVLGDAFQINKNGGEIFLGNLLIKGDCIAIISLENKLK
mmetsp:Transcript_22254/g.43293  ORF Transcript_22254/g.43293 Transcript_22254/m.43293 type:complete len:82 (-) Transcript_22254:25-270(-)